MYQLLLDLKDFSAAHRLVKQYRGKCNHLHGHNYRLNLCLGTSELDNNDLVIDFSLARQVCDAWVQTHLDHATLVYEHDDALREFLTCQNQKQYVISKNTTVEVMACEIYKHLSELLSSDPLTRDFHLTLIYVELWESARSGLRYNPSDSQARGTALGVHCGHQ